MQKFIGIGSLKETSLHASLKIWYALPGDQLEVPVDGYLVDIKRGDLLIEVQTSNLSALKPKLLALLAYHPVRVVCPIASEKWILREIRSEYEKVQRRKSPKHGRLEHVFDELVFISSLLTHERFSLEILLTKEEEIQQKTTMPTSRRAWRRRGWQIQDRRLVEVLDRRLFSSPLDYHNLLPIGLGQPFTTTDLAKAASISRRLAQKMAYTLRSMEIIHRVGKRDGSYLYDMSSLMTARNLRSSL